MGTNLSLPKIASDEMLCQENVWQRDAWSCVRCPSADSKCVVALRINPPRTVLYVALSSAFCRPVAAFLYQLKASANEGKVVPMLN